ncbi:MAG TPA: hypothetical protein VMN39_09690 [Longimicrobiaceae bacterium]|nr:hypothetical protein [Longimicrobiaceae bacterium]
MQPTLPLLFQRLPPDRIRKLELAMAAAIEARLDTHAEQALNLVAVLSSRMAFDQAVERYIDIMALGGEEAQIVRTRALVALSESAIAEELSRDRPAPRLSWKYATPLGAVRFVRRRLRRNAEEDLWMELSAARAEEALIRTHVKHALNFITILEEHVPPTRAVSLYLEQLEVPTSRARSVYQRTLARVAAAELPHLQARPDGHPEPHSPSH